MVQTRRARRITTLITATTVTALVAVGTAGCSTAQKAEPLGAKNPTGTIQLWERAGIDPWTKKVVAAFNASHKNLKVVLTSINDAQINTKLSTVFRTNNVPDVVLADDVDGLPYIQSGNMANLTSQLDASGMKSDLSAPQLKLATLNGKVYGTPAVLDASVLFYNKALFAKAGLTAPPSTLDELVTDAQKIRELGSSTYGFNFAGNCAGCLTFTVLPSLYADKSDVFTGSDLTKQTATIEGNTVLQKTLQAYQTIWKDGLAPKSVQSDNGSLWNKNFLGGNIGMATGGLGTYSAASAAMKKNIGIAPIPGATGGISTYIGGANFGIPAKAKNQAGAWEYIKFASGKKMQALLPSAGFAPIRNDLVNDKSFTSANPEVVPGLTAAATGSAPFTLYHNQLFSLEAGPWQTMFTKAVFGGDVAGAMKQGQTGFTSVLSGSGN
ncbi:sugar ABC transporter substrate-binding protein [Frondihabitans sucicola]|uniref:Sugar ABC transporter substrate-binding protein n=1 Tax=Frondihabitans sucicola TaxID=1268041 RepID=A0ABM8GMR7_9MICO|nr:sugar ABC transporter substrate-binding protein [Frondihabitans sucicola]BDZ49731.1 sugar ABC transporter substrate-binding protein [Frondihabitans sucicola]